MKEKTVVFSVEKEIAGRTLSIETGKLARQADGAVTVRYGDTVVFVSAVAQESKEDAGFLALTVEYREKIYAAGKIPGGYFKREGRPTAKEILTMRLIDRPLRPLFPENYKNEVQVTAFVFSADQENDPDIVAMIGASAALVLSPNIPFNLPTGSVRVGRIQGEFILNPKYSELEKSDMNIVITGTNDAITMVEGEAKEVSEQAIVDAIFWGHQYIKSIIAMQKELAEKAGISPASLPPVDTQEKEFACQKIQEKYYADLQNALETKGKKNRGKAVDNLLTKIQEEFASLEETAHISSNTLSEAYESLQKKVVREWLRKNKRVDGRTLKEIRPIQCEVGYLPRTHGSAIFTRGETQSLVTITLGSTMDEQIIEGLTGDVTKRFMLHYEFPPFCTGEVKQSRGPSRREIGHGNLAERALEQILPDENRFPYTIRVVSEIMESNGSSSMASVCGGTLALMDAGVPIKRPVAGIAMGLLKEENSFYIISDILGTEDHYGEMDFKVAGTQKGITALQMDIKTTGISKEIFMQALEQAKEGRFHILREMMLALNHPKRSISPYAPRVFRMQVNPEKISTVIGPAGKTIRSIQETTGSKIAVEDNGSITIYCQNQEGATQAQETIQQLTEEVKIGKIYTGKAVSIKDFGVFVEILPGIEGLVHVSELAKNYVANVSEVVKIGDKMKVKVLSIDDQNRIKLSKKAADRESEAN